MLICAGMVALAGVIVMLFRAVASTIKLAVLLTAPTCAVIVTAPADWPVVVPDELMLAIVGSEELQVTTLEMFCVVPSLYFPVAV